MYIATSEANKFLSQRNILQKYVQLREKIQNRDKILELDPSAYYIGIICAFCSIVKFMLARSRCKIIWIRFVLQSIIVSELIGEGKLLYNI